MVAQLQLPLLLHPQKQENTPLVDGIQKQTGLAQTTLLEDPTLHQLQQLCMLSGQAAIQTMQSHFQLRLQEQMLLQQHILLR